MDPTTAVEQTGGSRAASSDPGHRVGLPKEAELLWCELRGLAHDHLQLAALETQRAGESLVTMIAVGMIVAGLLLSAWLGLRRSAAIRTSPHPGTPTTPAADCGCWRGTVDDDSGGGSRHRARARPAN